VVFAAVFLRFLGRLPAMTKHLLIAAGVMYVMGAAGMELIGRDFYGGNEAGATYVAVVGSEESLEMLGVLVLVYALLAYVRDHIGSIRVTWLPGPELVSQYEQRWLAPAASSR
jgi:hypothetical protein